MIKVNSLALESGFGSMFLEVKLRRPMDCWRKFQEELPLEEFQSAIDESGLPDSPELKEVELDLIRFSNCVERTPAVGLAAYYSVSFIDGSQQAVLCEFGLENDTHGLLFFANDFEVVIPRVKTESVLSGTWMPSCQTSQFKWNDY